MLAAQLVERGALRYTPAGLPALDCRLAQNTVAFEDGQPRRVALELKALAIGAVTRPLDAMSLGASATFAGFVANARNGRGILFHITSLTPIATSPTRLPEVNEVHHAPTQR